MIINRNLLNLLEKSDLSSYIANAKVGIAPALGEGISWQDQSICNIWCSCIASSVSAKGLAYENGIDISITDEPELFADYCIRLLKNNKQTRIWDSWQRKALLSILGIKN